MNYVPLEPVFAQPQAASFLLYLFTSEPFLNTLLFFLIVCVAVNFYIKNAILVILENEGKGIIKTSPIEMTGWLKIATKIVLVTGVSVFICQATLLYLLKYFTSQ